MNSLEPHHIIAIGASAGGMEEINTFFDHTPLDGVSYVIVQHLSPDFKSRMVELLGKHSKLDVTEAREGMEVTSNQVYLIPSDKFMTISDNKLNLFDKSTIKGPHLTINKFFESLALNSGNKAIGILLSGMGSDGTDGIRLLKKAGGMVMVRDPQTSEFPSMPSHAIATGVVDFVLEPELMPLTIEEFVKEGDEAIHFEEIDENNLQTIIEIINQQLPLDFSEYKKSTILRRIKRRAAAHNFTKLEAYIELLRSSPEEVELLTKDFLISVTSFFRDKKSFDFIKTDVIPDILSKLQVDEEFKIWVPGCALGEEAYSLAIIIHEQLKKDNLLRIVKIFATDIDSNALVHAGKGVYPKSIAKDVPERILDKYFFKEGDSYRIGPVIRRMVIFANHDLVKNPPYCNMHLISCRNLLIYMTPVLQRKIFAMLLFGLKKNGFLFLGSSENPLPIIENLEVVNKKLKVYKNLESKRFVRFDAFSLPILPDKSEKPNKEKDLRKVVSGGSLEKLICESIVTSNNIVAICINESKEVLQTFGDTSKYLLQKNFTSNLSELLPQALSIAFNNLCMEALSTNKAVSIRGINFQKDERDILVALTVEPIDAYKIKQKTLLVKISEDNNAVNHKVGIRQFDESASQSQYIRSLEIDLKQVKEKLESAFTG